ncbi:signal peptidase complex subunit 1-like [Trachemys scripta elegans]|uniref:signal peptidase complex subunit 1-like n=1 Tax=Trachemys scripta elegans TaxID=31138 RepID=UPI0015579E7E|nr:signal peptidase complex subunit 1-like [Trachemys scripta elegans]
MLDIFGSIPTQMGYKSQKLAEQIFRGIILVSAVIGFIYGYVAEQFGWAVYIVMAGFALSCLLTFPPWPMYRRNPLKWLPVQESGTEDKKPAERTEKAYSKLKNMNPHDVTLENFTSLKHLDIQAGNFHKHSLHTKIVVTG